MVLRSSIGEPAVDGRQHEQGQEGRGYKSTDHDRGERSLDLGAPALVASAIGMNPKDATIAVMSTGRTLAYNPVPLLLRPQLRHGLTPVERSERIAHSAPSREELELSVRTGRPSFKEQLRQSIRVAAEGEPTLSEFVDRLDEMGVRVVANVQSTGRVSGGHEPSASAVRGFPTVGLRAILFGHK